MWLLLLFLGLISECPHGDPNRDGDCGPPPPGDPHNATKVLDRW